MIRTMFAIHKSIYNCLATYPTNCSSIMPPSDILHDHHTLKKHAAAILEAIYPAKATNVQKSVALMAFYSSRCVDEAVSTLYIAPGKDYVAHGLYHSSTSYDIPWESFPMASMLVSINFYPISNAATDILLLPLQVETRLRSIMNLDHTWNGQHDIEWRHAAVFSKTERDIYDRHLNYWCALMAKGSYFRDKCLQLVNDKNKRLGLRALVHAKSDVGGMDMTGWEKPPQVLHVINPAEFNAISEETATAQVPQSERQ